MNQRNRSTDGFKTWATEHQGVLVPALIAAVTILLILGAAA